MSPPAPRLATAGQIPGPQTADRYGYEMKWDGVRESVVLGVQVLTPSGTSFA